MQMLLFVALGLVQVRVQLIPESLAMVHNFTLQHTASHNHITAYHIAEHYNTSFHMI